MTLAPGAPFGRYRILHLVGVGGMGAVYLAEDTSLGRSVALKLLQVAPEPANEVADATTVGPRLGSSPKKVRCATDAPSTMSRPTRRSPAEQLLAEARAAARVQHAHAIAIFDVGETDGTPYLAMEFVAGDTLRHYINHRRAPLARRIAWLMAVAEALEAAHANGVVHRDVKPENVMVRNDGTIKVLDFGIARAVAPSRWLPVMQPHNDGVEEPPPSSRGRGDNLVGTLAYMSPEQLCSEPVDGRADQFAWGVLAYELLTRTLPWQRDEGRDELLTQILFKEPDPPSKLVPAIPPHVDAVVLRALSKAQADRFGSMAEVVRALRVRPSVRAVARASRRSLGTIVGRAVPAALAASLFFGASTVDSRPIHVVLPIRAGGTGTVLESKMSAVPEATAEYRLGMQAARDASGASSRHHFERATELDPAFAAAHLRKVLVTVLADDVARSHLNKAFQLRADLGDHDRALLHAIEPWARVPQAMDQAVARFEEETRIDGDPDDFLQLARLQLIAGDHRGAIASATVAAERDPSLAAAMWIRGSSELLLDEVAVGRKDLDDCLAIAPNATSCLNEVLAIDAVEGRCVDVIAIAGRMTSLEPNQPRIWDAAAGAILASGGGKAEARAALERVHALAPPKDAERVRALRATKLALYSGEFAVATEALAAWKRALQTSLAEDEHFDLLQVEVAFEEELGHPEAAAAAAAEYLTRRAAWMPLFYVDASIYALAALHRNGALSSPEFAPRRAEWLTAMQSRPTTSGQYSMTAGALWAAAYAIGIATTEDARNALAALPAYQPLPPLRNRNPDIDRAVGHTYFVAGRMLEAIPHLQRAARSCRGLDYPIDQARAMFELGVALDAVGDHREACATFSALAARWSHPSVTGDAARLRAPSCKR